MKITILDYTDEGEELLARCGLATTTERPPSEYEVTEEDVSSFMDISRDMELSSVFNFPTVIYEVKNVSRSFTHQHVRHRMAAHMQQSLRYTEIDPTDPGFFITPPSITKKGKEETKRYIENQLNSAKTYKELLEKEVPPEDARFALPIGVKTFLTTAMNVESLLHYINLRACMDSQWEIRANAYALLTACKLIYPDIFDKAGPHCISSRCKGRGKGECKPEAQEIIKEIEDKIEEKKPIFTSEGDSVEIDLTGTLGYRPERSLVEDLKMDLGFEELDLSFEVKLEINKK